MRRHRSPSRWCRKMLIDRDGDAANNGTGFGKPAKDLSINFVPVPYPDYPPATIEMKPGERQLWRVLNASAITYLNLAVLLADTRRSRSAWWRIDGVPFDDNGSPATPHRVARSHRRSAGRPRRVHRDGPAAGRPALLVTRTVDTGQGGENDPNRALATIIAAMTARRAALHLAGLAAAARRRRAALARQMSAPVRVRKLYFSEKARGSDRPQQRDEFYITVDGQTPAPFDPQPRSRTSWSAGRRRGLDHREPLDRAARLSHPSDSFPADGHGPARRSTSRFCATPSTCRTTATACSNIRACGCAWIFAIRTRSARSCITAICSSTKMAA